MKKKALLAIAVIMALGSVRAMAQMSEMDAIDQEIAMGKLDATELSVETSDVRRSIQELSKMQDDLAEVEDTNGLMGALAQTITSAEQVLKSSGDDVEKMKMLKKELRERVQEMKRLDPRNQIRGLKVHDDLEFQ